MLLKLLQLKITYLTLIFGLLTPSFFNGSVEKSDQILFLQFTIENNTLQLISAEVVNGTLKESRKKTLRYGIKFQLLDSLDSILHEGVEHDPQLFHHESIKDDGSMQKLYHENKDHNLFIRIPYNENASSIVFKRLEPQSQENSTTFERTSIIKELQISKILIR